MTLAELRWHWGGAYRIDQDQGEWTAIRRDTGALLRAWSAYDLNVKILADYQSQPVPRR